jgi:predicted methyltransferase
MRRSEIEPAVRAGILSAPQADRLIEFLSNDVSQTEAARFSFDILLFLALTHWFNERKGLYMPAGIMATLAVVVVPLAIFSLQTALAVLVLASLPLAALAQSPSTHQHSFQDAERWSHVFDDPKRDAWQKPHEVIRALALKPESVVADVGAGTGYFAARLANMVPKGKVYAVDVEPGMVKHLAERAKKEKRANLFAVQGAPDDPKLPEMADVVLLVDVYHHIDDRTRYFRRLQASLKPGGQIAIIDFRLDSPEGPPRAARVPPEQVVAELKSAGYRLAKQHGFLPNQYFLVFIP